MGAAEQTQHAISVRLLTRRPTLDLLAIALLFTLAVAVSCLTNTYGQAFIRALAEPIEVQIHGLTPADLDSVSVTYLSTSVDPDTRQHVEGNGYRTSAAFRWIINWQWVKELHVHFADGALNRVTGVSVAVGNERVNFSGAQVRNWRQLPLMPWVLLNARHPDISLRIPVPARPMFGGVLNWPQTAVLLRNIVFPAGLFVVVAIAAALAFLRAIRGTRFQRFAARTLAGDFVPSLTPSRFWLLFGLAIVIAGIAMHERMHSYAFTQDDNFNQFLPVVVRSGETLLSGRMPAWNPYQLLGSPTTTVGTYMLTYPPTYICWAIARFVFRNDNLTIEIFSILHLLAGYLATFWALRRMGIRPPLAATGGFCFILSGWFLVAGASQATFVPLAVFLPLLFDAANRLSRAEGGWRWSLYTGALIGVYFHAGHAQMWAYSVLGFVVTILLMAASRGISWRRASWVVSALLFGFALAAPLFVLQFRETEGILRIGGYGTGAVLSTMLLPLGSLVRDPRLLSGVYPEYAAEMFHFGVVFAGAAAVGLLLLAGLSITCLPTVALPRRACIARNPWLLPAGVFVLLSLGDKAVVWTALSLLPVFNKFRWPIKFAPLIALASIFAGAVILERWMLPGGRSAARWIALVSAGLMLFHVTLCKSTWYTMADRPYPQFPAGARRLMEPDPGRPERFIAINPFRSSEPGYFQSLALNYATEARLVAFDGYDTFVGATRENRTVWIALRGASVQTARVWATGWLLVHDLALHPKYSPNPMLWSCETPGPLDQESLWSLRSRGQLAWHGGNLWLYRLPDPQPMAFSTSAPRQPLAIQLDQAGISITTDGVAAGDTVTAAYLWRPWMRARIDGRIAPAVRDGWGRVSTRLSRPAHSVRFEYSPPWGLSCLAGLAALALAAACGAVSRRLCAAAP